MHSAIESRDGAAMQASLRTLTATCNACHAAERVPFVTVAPPTARISPVHFEGPRGE